MVGMDSMHCVEKAANAEKEGVTSKLFLNLMLGSGRNWMMDAR